MPAFPLRLGTLRQGRTMFDLLYAAAVGDLPSVRHCVLRSRKSNFLWGDLTRTCCRGRAAIQYAVLGGHADVAAELIDAGATD